MQNDQDKNLGDDYKEDYDLEPSELVGKKYQTTENTKNTENTKTPKPRDNKSDNQEVSRKAALEDLAKQLEDELGGQVTASNVDLRSQNDEHKKSSDILEMEKEIEDLEDDLLPGVEIRPERELEVGDDVSLPAAKTQQETLRPFDKTQGRPEEIEGRQAQGLREQEREDKLDKQKRQAKAKKQEVKIKKKSERDKKKRDKQKQRQELKAQIQKEKEFEQQQRELWQQQKQAEKAKQQQERKDSWQEERQRKLSLKLKQRQEKQEQKIKQVERPAEYNQFNFGWQIKTIKRPVLYLAGIEWLIYFFSLLPSIRPFLIDNILPLVLFLDIIVFGWLMNQIIKKQQPAFLLGLKSVILAGILVGLLRALFKVVWINQAWTVPNIVIEPLLTGAIALAVGVVVGIILKIKNKR